MPTPTQLALIGAYFVVIALIIGVFLYLRKRQSTETQQQPQAQAGAGAGAGAGAAARRPPRRQQAGGEARAAPAAAAGVAAAARDPDADGDEDEEDVEDEKLTGATAKQRKKMEKLARQQAREDQRRAQDDKAEARARKEAERAAIREKKEEERNAVLKALEDEAAARRAEELKAQEAEFEEWKDMITVDTAGSGESDVMTESQGLLQEFIDYIKKKKVVVLDDVASEFNLKTQDVVNRIEVLEKSGMISGVLDDRGKFIFITPEELDAVANFIKRRGRVSITDVVSESNKLIDLTVRETVSELDDIDNKENKNNDTQDVVHEIQF